MLIFNDEIKSRIANIELEISAIQHTFTKTVEEIPNSFKPFAVFFVDAEQKLMASACRDVVDEPDYYTAISEMLFAYTSFDASAVMLAIDATKEIQGHQQDLLEVYVACDEFCVVFSMPYSRSQDNKIIWLEDKYNSYTIEKLERAYDTSGNLYATIEIIEALYLHTHLNVKLFDGPRMASFLRTNDYEFHVFDEDKTKEQTSL